MKQVKDVQQGESGNRTSSAPEKGRGAGSTANCTNQLSKQTSKAGTTGRGLHDNSAA